jgi:hypothetical protein
MWVSCGKKRKEAHCSAHDTNPQKTKKNKEQIKKSLYINARKFPKLRVGNHTNLSIEIWVGFEKKKTGGLKKVKHNRARKPG